jgi:hypothetical protein
MVGFDGVSGVNHMIHATGDEHRTRSLGLRARTIAMRLLATGVVCAAVLAGTGDQAVGAMAVDDEGKVKVSVDFRLRFEMDWDSKRANGTERSDRNRARIRGRIGAQYDPIPELGFAVRLRTGSKMSQQSPHLTVADFSSDGHGDRDATLDKYYAKAKLDPVWVWGGRNSFPFWKQNELFWDDDVTLLGGAAGFDYAADFGKLSLIGGYFRLPDGTVHYAGEMGAGQVVYSGEVSEGVRLTAAAGLFALDGDGDGDIHLRNNNGQRDYTIGVASLQVKMTAFELPLAFGLDLMHNFEDYSASDADAFTAANHDEDTGFVIQARIGGLKEKGEWLAGYYYSCIETLAVNAAYAQDDWVRWGSGGQTDSSDLKGHELRLAYALAGNANLVARLYIVEAITSAQDGKRFRLDFNIKF